MCSFSQTVLAILEQSRLLRTGTALLHGEGGSGGVGEGAREACILDVGAVLGDGATAAREQKQAANSKAGDEGGKFLQGNTFVARKIYLTLPRNCPKRCLPYWNTR